MGRIIYLTGAPATGKSTLTELLTSLPAQIRVFTYSKELARVVSERTGPVTQQDMRAKSAALITRQDVEQVDRELIAVAAMIKKDGGTLIIDSHPVTIETFGFRVTPFSKAQLHDLAPNVIVCLYADPRTLSDRIKANPAGRPLPSASELDRHVTLQCEIASIYAFEIGAELFFLDAGKPGEEVLQNFLKVSKLLHSNSH
ncbi:adenylate kinase [Pseudomonas koreensis]|uniref:ATP-binding protein n=1 Tax=Pseudomonas koreensis TaxID=198620 RepID=UPI0028599A4B|nr:ATP-binding protein [Pseudomonas koreensis]MDR7052901.1 adenylate kinase [Pseudomonas koreensis]